VFVKYEHDGITEAIVMSFGWNPTAKGMSPDVKKYGSAKFKLSPVFPPITALAEAWL